MKKNNVFLTVIMVVSLIIGLLGCGTSPVTQNEAASGTKSQPQKVETDEEQVAKFNKLLEQDFKPIRERQKANGEGWKATAADIDEILKPREVSGAEANIFMRSAETGKPYYFKIRAIYKGYDKKNKFILLEDTTKTVSQEDELLGKAFGVDVAVYAVYSSDEPTKVKESNTVATFYCLGYRATENGRSEQRLQAITIDDANIVTLFDKSKFIVASGLSYISPSSVSVPNQQDIMMNMFTGGVSGNNSANIFDPIKYPLVDLMDARVAMDKKDLRNDYTLPRVQVKYVSEVVFKGQSNTNITVSTTDNVLTEIMNFTGRASSIRNGEKVRVYYTIAKDPLEKWEIQAIERL